MNLIRQNKIKNPRLASQVIDKPHQLGRYLGYKDLVQLHTDWIKYIWRTKEHSSIQAHRNSFKTTAIIIVGSILDLTFNWNDRISIIRKDFTSASDVAKIISRHIQGEKYQAFFYELFGFYPGIITDSSTKFEWDIKETQTPEGNIMPFGIGGSITGKHFDWILCDDIITIRDRISRVERNAVDEFIREIIANVIEPGKYVKFSGTPWHKMDTWRLLPIPLIFDVYSTGLKAFTPARIAEIKKYTTASLFAANYELKHISSDETIFQEPSYIKTWDTTIPLFGHIDAKYQGSHTGAFTIMGPKPDGRIQAIGFKFDRHIEEEYTKLMSLWRKYRCGTVSLELNADKGYAARDLNTRGMFTRTYSEHENKHVKIIQNLKKYYSLIDWHEDTDPEYIAQIMDYIEGQEPDDCADSAASCIRENRLITNSSIITSAEEYEDTAYRE